MLAGFLFLPALQAAVRDLSVFCVDPTFARLLERWPLFDNLITHQAECVALRKSRDLPKIGTIFEAKLEVAHNDRIVRFHDLFQVPVRDDFTMQIAKHKKPEGHTFNVMHWDGSAQRRGADENKHEGTHNHSAESTRKTVHPNSDAMMPNTRAPAICATERNLPLVGAAVANVLVGPLEEVLYIWRIGVSAIVLAPCELAIEQAVIYWWHFGYVIVVSNA